MFREYYTELINNLMLAYCMSEALLDKDGNVYDWKYLDINKTFEEYVGVKKEDVIGHTIMELFPNSENHWIEAVDKAKKEGGTIRIDARHEDTKKDYHVHYYFVKENIFITLFIDVTEQREKFRKLQINEDRYRKLIESQNALIVRINNEGLLTLVNEAYCNKFGKKREEILGTNFAPRIHPEDLEKTKETMRNLFSPPYKSNMVQRAWTPNGWKSISWEDQVIRDEQGNIIEIQAIGYDITDTIESHIELEKSNQDLEDFAYVASHDLQEPLRKITAFENLLSENIEESNDYINDESKLYLKKISEAAFRMKNLIEDLLEYSRVSRNKDPFVFVNIKDILHDLLKNELEERIKESVPIININWDDFNYTKCDPTQIKQLFQNILSNSMKFKDEDRELIIGISCRKLEKDRGCMLSFEDNGIGFDQKYAKEVFLSFQKLHSKDKYPGSGIGLAICKRIIERHKWKISASSEEGIGTMFSIIYPGENGGSKDGIGTEQKGDINSG